MMDLSPLWISLRVALGATLISVVLGLVLGYVIFRYKRWRSLIDGLLTLPVVLPPTVIGLVLLVCFGNNSGIGRILNSMGISIVFNIRGAIVAASVVAIPLFTKTILTAIETLDEDVLNVARTLGMSEWYVFHKIVLPQIMPAMRSGIVLAFSRALGEFGATLMIAGNIPGQTQTMSIAIYSAIQSGNKEIAYIWGATIIIFSVLSIVMMKKWTRTKW